LWGAIWGYVALDEDKDTVYGVYFSHESETPGLGAEIADSHFQSNFQGRRLMKGDDIGLSVVKAGRVSDATYQVDGITGGTITSNGVDDMLKNCLSQYHDFLTAK
ncbi:MAG: FMN-binding protein, partial [Bacteroidales bacterium]|nr:FMN-binding protein [Bacteroidales bacterium]